MCFHHSKFHPFINELSKWGLSLFCGTKDSFLLRCFEQFLTVWVTHCSLAYYLLNFFYFALFQLKRMFKLQNSLNGEITAHYSTPFNYISLWDSWLVGWACQQNSEKNLRRSSRVLAGVVNPYSSHIVEFSANNAVGRRGKTGRFRWTLDRRKRLTRK